MVRSSSSCCKLSLHSRSASESSSSSLGDIEVSEPADEEGSESTSSNVLAGGMFAYDDDGSDMLAVLLVIMSVRLQTVVSTNERVFTCKHVNAYITIVVPSLISSANLL